MGGVLSSMWDGHPWVVGRGLSWSLGVVCGCWVLFVGAGCCSCALGALVGAGHVSQALGCCRLCVVGIGAPSHGVVVECDVVAGRGVVVGREVVVACFGGPGSQLG